MPTLDKYRLRLELELAQGIAAAPVNLFTGAAPLVPRSRDLQWEIVLLNNGALDSSVGNITSMVLEVKTFQSPASSPLISVSISGAAPVKRLTGAAAMPWASSSSRRRRYLSRLGMWRGCRLKAAIRERRLQAAAECRNPSSAEGANFFLHSAFCLLHWLDGGFAVMEPPIMR